MIVGAWLPVAVLLLASCGAAPDLADGGSRETPAPGVPLYRGNGLVLQEPSASPVLCLGVTLESLPPQCGGAALDTRGWDWDAVEGEESARGVTWGYYEVTGHFDGDVFTVTDAGSPPPVPADEDAITTPCEEPEGGWGAPGSGDRDRAVAAARREPDFAGAWVDGPVLNLAFTRDLDRHKREIAEIWNGPLCLVQHEHTLDRLREIQRELDPEEFGLEGLWSSVDEVDNVVEFGVIVADPEALAEIERRYGPGTVVIDPALEPVN